MIAQLDEAERTVADALQAVKDARRGRDAAEIEQRVACARRMLIAAADDCQRVRDALDVPSWQAETVTGNEMRKRLKEQAELEAAREGIIR